MSKLTIHENERATVYEILEDSLTIGSRQGCGIRVSDPVVSSEHCQITLVPGVGYKLIDLESRDGTKVNGAYVNQHLLREGDVIQIGAVRISFTGGAPATSAPGPAAAPVAASPAVPAAPARPVPAAAPVRPARPSARPKYAGYPSEPPREYRQPRRGRGGDSSAIILMGVAVGLLLVVVIVIAVVSSGSGATGNERILLEMEQLMSNHRYQEAIDLAGQADPTGDPSTLAKIELNKQGAANLKARKGGINAENAALVAYQRVESWIQKHRQDIPGSIKQWETMARDHAGTHWAFKAKRNMDALLSGGRNPEGITLYPGGAATIDRAFTEVQTNAKALEEQEKFQAVITSFFDFWEEYKLKTTDLATWEKRVQDEVKAVERRAESRWESLDSLAKQYVKNGEYDAAKRMYRKVTDNFGIEKYVVQAEAALKKIGR